MERVFYRDMNPSNVLVSPQGELVHVDLMNNDTNPRGVDLWYLFGFLPPQYFKKYLQLVPLDIKELSVVALMETMKFSGYFHKNSHSVLKPRYRDMLRNCHMLVQQDVRLQQYLPFLEALKDEWTGRPVSLDFVLQEAILQFPHPNVLITYSGARMPDTIEPAQRTLLGTHLFPYLLENAIEACDTSGSVRVTTYCRDYTQVTEIRDTGHGVDDPESLLGLGKTTKGSGRGRGLFFANLSVRALCGELKLSSMPGQGFTAVIELPLRPEVDRTILDYLMSFP